MDLNNYIQMLIQSGIKFGHCECNSSHWIVSECFDYNDNNSMVITQFTNDGKLMSLFYDSQYKNISEFLDDDGE